MRTIDGSVDVSFDAEVVDSWSPTTLFRSVDEAVQFFEEGDCGYAPSIRAGCFEGIRLVTPPWRAEPLSVEQAWLSYFADTLGVPESAMRFDSAFLIRDLVHEWVGLPPMVVGAEAQAGKAMDLKTEVRATGVSAAA